ncbi:uncharacterized protein SPSK_09239 [Sporothrix schenckii 1099-18]|uniref:Uncharacterized protein n=1 Tax=Sporothrix schenckii 1099-18 TaxID=1397361 RepID=A0A0F2M6D5_SPOSC|nr:uncharacterized protein SPSK_09239 [Sporothrix schenckii 1099-18]KJR85197.1 hypothetical protein SPSK_09239 [Sporothrix schenckii 1099-18]
MKWHRNPFFHTAVMPPSVAPSALASARPSADLDTATAAAFRASLIARNATSARPSTDLLHPPAGQASGQASGRPSITIAPAPAGHPDHADHPDNPVDPSQHLAPHGILAEAANRVAHGRRHIGRRKTRKVPKLTICEPSDHLTPYQAFYIFGIDGLGAFVLSGGINFAIGYAMYKTINVEKHPIRLFQFPNTLAGDATVTIFIQCVLTWFIELVLVNRDLRSGHIQPIGFLHEPSNALVRWFLLLDRRPPANDAEANKNNGDDGLRRPLSAPHDENCRCEQHSEQYEIGSWKHWAVFLVSQLIRALLAGVLMWMVLWPVSIGILTAVGDKGADGDWWFGPSSWAPPVFKLILGGVLALLTTPPFAAFWLVRCGWAVQANERHLNALADAAAVEAAAAAASASVSGGVVGSMTGGATVPTVDVQAPAGTTAESSEEREGTGQE